MNLATWLSDVCWLANHSLSLRSAWAGVFSIIFKYALTRAKTHKRLKECFLIGQNRMKLANFWGSPFFQATYNIKTGEKKQFNLSLKKRTSSNICLFWPIKMHSFNLLCVLDLFFLQNAGSQLFFRFIFFTLIRVELHWQWGLIRESNLYWEFVCTYIWYFHLFKGGIDLCVELLISVLIYVWNHCNEICWCHIKDIVVFSDGSNASRWGRGAIERNVAEMSGELHFLLQ